MPALKKGELKKFGYKSFTLREGTLDNLTGSFKEILQKQTGSKYGDPVLSDYVDFLIQFFRNSKNLPRLMLVAKSNYRTTLFDTQTGKFVAVDYDPKKKTILCTSAESFEQYIAFSKKMNPDLHQRMSMPAMAAGSSDNKPQAAKRKRAEVG